MKLNDEKRTQSAYDYAPGECIISPEDFSHHSYSIHRILASVNVKERVYYDEWIKIASNTLAYLLSDKINKPDYENLSQRDLEVAASLMQWLGSNCGQYFIEQTQAKADEAWRNYETK
jgi:hypothetical protein